MNSLDELFHKAVGGDKAAENDLFRIIHERLLRLAKYKLRGDAYYEDVASEACRTVLQKLRDGAIKSAFSTYASTVLRNTIGNHLQKVKRRNELMEELHGVEDEQTSPTSDPIRRKTIIDCLRKIAGPHPEYARVLRMVVDGYTSEEICLELAIKRNTYYVWLFRARELLKRCLEKGGAL